MSTAAGRSVVLLAGDGASARIVCHHLEKDFEIEKVILERPIPRSEFLGRRVRRYGPAKVAGQVLFSALAVTWLRWVSRGRLSRLERRAGMDRSPLDRRLVVTVPSANSPEAHVHLGAIRSRVVVIHGTRILSEKTLAATHADFINLHAGITPRYRGVHGAYWALVQGEGDACGVTVHLVDKGIDTGTIIEQGLIVPEAEDNFLTYPVLQLEAGLPLLTRAVSALLDRHLKRRPWPGGGKRSRLWTHPTLLEYLWNRIRRGVK